MFAVAVVVAFVLSYLFAFRLCERELFSALYTVHLVAIFSTLTSIKFYLSTHQLNGLWQTMQTPFDRDVGRVQTYKSIDFITVIFMNYAVEIYDLQKISNAA